MILNKICRGNIGGSSRERSRRALFDDIEEDLSKIEIRTRRREA